MKKAVSVVTILITAFVFAFSLNVYAASLGNVNVTTTKTTIKSGENVTLDIEFGEELGSYTFDIAYDSNLFEYVSSEGGTANDNGTRVRVYFFDETGGTNPRSNMSVTFKAKTVDSTTTTNLSVTAEGLANPDASVTYDDITTAIVKDVTIESTETTTPDTNNDNTNTDNDTNVDTDNNDKKEETNDTEADKPTKMPQTGNTIYIYAIPTIAILSVLYVTLKNRN